jgi:ADP-ribosylglycohydrolase
MGYSGFDALCVDSLAGLSVGDALGAQFFVPGHLPEQLRAGRLPDAPWEWTDDTEMACSVVAHLRARGAIDPDRLAVEFAQRCEPYRGYGGGAVAVLHEIRDGRPWALAAGAAFDGQGSWGNGAAMRVAPLGAYFAGDPRRAAREAIASAEVTHAHPEGVLGAVAVAVAASVVAGARVDATVPVPEALLAAVHALLVEGAVRRGVDRARRLLGATPGEAAYELGNGSRVAAHDTVPFALWTAATHLADYPAAIITCVEAGGDVDTTAAIVGGIVASYTGMGNASERRGVPTDWLARREPLPPWLSE